MFSVAAVAQEINAAVTHRDFMAPIILLEEKFLFKTERRLRPNNKIFMKNQNLMQAEFSIKLICQHKKFQMNFKLQYNFRKKIMLQKLNVGCWRLMAG